MWSQKELWLSNRLVIWRVDAAAGSGVDGPHFDKVWLRNGPKTPARCSCVPSRPVIFATRVYAAVLANTQDMRKKGLTRDQSYALLRCAALRSALLYSALLCSGIPRGGIIIWASAPPPKSIYHNLTSDAKLFRWFADTRKKRQLLHLGLDITPQSRCTMGPGHGHECVVPQKQGPLLFHSIDGFSLIEAVVQLLWSIYRDTRKDKCIESIILVILACTARLGSLRVRLPNTLARNPVKDLARKNFLSRSRSSKQRRAVDTRYASATFHHRARNSSQAQSSTRDPPPPTVTFDSLVVRHSGFNEPCGGVRWQYIMASQKQKQRIIACYCC